MKKHTSSLHMHHDDAHKKRVLHRLKIIRGHMDRVIRMVEDDSYCIDILQQTTAVTGAIHQTEQVILENHLRSCVTDAMTDRIEVEKKVEEVIKVFKARK